MLMYALSVRIGRVERRDSSRESRALDRRCAVCGDDCAGPDSSVRRESAGQRETQENCRNETVRSQAGDRWKYGHVDAVRQRDVPVIGVLKRCSL